MRYFKVLILVLLIGFVSCNDGNRCYESVDTLMMSSFSIDQFKTINTLIIKGIKRNSIGDTIVNDQSAALRLKATLPLSLTADSTGFVLIANGVNDTLYVRHNMIISLISSNCGYAPSYTISGLRYTKGIDSVKVKDAAVNNTSVEKTTNDQNISIYFNPAIH